MIRATGWLPLLLLVFVAHAQKKPLDTSDFGKWPLPENAQISNDGTYTSYSIRNRTTGTATLTIKGIADGWKKEYNSNGGLVFSSDSRKALLKDKDSLYIISLGKEQADEKIALYSAKSPGIAKGEWIAFEPKDQNGDLTVLNLLNGGHLHYHSVAGYSWENHGKCLLLTVKNGKETDLQRISLPGGKITTIWSGSQHSTDNLSLNDATFDARGEQLAFLTREETAVNSPVSVWYCGSGSQQATKLADSQSTGIGTGMSVTGKPEFSENGRWLFLQLQQQPKTAATPKPGMVQVDVYSYKDFFLQSQQLRNVNENPAFYAAVSVSGGSVVQLEQPVDGYSRLITGPEQITGDYAVVGEQLHRDFKPWWLSMGYPSGMTYYLVSLHNGKKTLLRPGVMYPASGFTFSPDGHWLVYWDSRYAGYISYNIATQKTVFATRSIPNLAQSGDYINMFGISTYPQPIDEVRWTDGGKAFLVNDRYDIWKVDPSGKTAPLNLTNGYGARHHVLMRLVDETADYSGNEHVLLAGFNEFNKDNSFYKLSLSRAADPQLLTSGPYCYFYTGSQLPDHPESFSQGEQPVKVADADAWIVHREKADGYPNLFYTSDWKNFTPITDLQPQKDYNWLTSELVNYKQLDGTASQGVLYKPENFDPKHKYPVIFTYYEHTSSRLNEFMMPNYTADNINIPWFVNHGYLVFTPDIHYSVASSKGGKTVGESVLNSVEGAAKYLAKLPYVDGKHMGIQGHSFGGGETNFLATHSDLFAAACSASGTVSDQVSAYLGPYRRKGEEPNFYRVQHSENGHEMIGATLWQRPDLYFRSSSVFNANHVTMPLLLMHNEHDNQTDWGQSFELFTALTRLGKPVWLLQYDNGLHSLVNVEDQKDFTIRLMQFFDHYLKGAPAPKWMVEGIPAKLKGIDAGYELEPGIQP